MDVLQVRWQTSTSKTASGRQLDKKTTISKIIIVKHIEKHLGGNNDNKSSY